MSLLFDSRQPLRSITISNLASGGVICTAAQLDSVDVIFMNQTADSKLVWLPTPTDTTKPKSIDLVANSTAPLWTAYGRFIGPASFSKILYMPGIGWAADHVEAPQTLYASGAAVALPIDTNENNIPLVTIPGGFCGDNSAIDTRWLVYNTSGTSNKTLKLKFGAMTPYSVGSLLASATAHHGLARSVFMTNSASAQIATGTAALGDGNSATTAAVTGTVDTSADVLVQMSVQKVTGTDVTTLRYARVAYIHKA